MARNADQPPTERATRYPWGSISPRQRLEKLDVADRSLKADEEALETEYRAKRDVLTERKRTLARQRAEAQKILDEQNEETRRKEAGKALAELAKAGVDITRLNDPDVLKDIAALLAKGDKSGPGDHPGSIKGAHAPNPEAPSVETTDAEASRDAAE